MNRVRATHDHHDLSHPMASGVLLRAVADVAVRYGVAPETVLEESERCFQTHQPIDVRVPLGDFRRMLRRAITLTGEPALALRVGLLASEPAFDMMAPLVSHVRSLRHAIQETSQFAPLILDRTYLHLHEGHGVAHLMMEFPRAHDSSDRDLAEFMVASLVRMLSAFGCAADALCAVHFEHARPAHHHVYAEAFRGTERFARETTEVAFPAQLLDRPNLHSSPVLQALVRAEAEQRLARMTRGDDVIDRVRAYLLNQPLAHVPEMSAAARALGVSVRTLRRRLGDADLSYRGLIQELHRERACLMLRNPETPLQSVAQALGFGDMTAFHKAFKRWTGVTASEYRQTH